jgi:hypothetical protein
VAEQTLDRLRVLLLINRQAFATGNKAEAFLKLKVAFDMLNRQVASKVQLISTPRSVVSGHWPHEIRQIIKQYEDLLDSMADTVNMLTLGIDPIKYASFTRISPAVSWTMAGTYHSHTWRTYEDVPAQVFETHFNFVVEVSLRISETFKEP